MISYSSAVNMDNIKYIETYECQECCKMKKGTPWVNYDNDKKCICSYLCFKSKKKEEKDLWQRVNNKSDFEDVRPIIKIKKKNFIFLTKRELLELQENELIQYYNDLNEYYWMNPERAELQQSIMDDSTFSDESESEYGSCSEEEYYFD